MKIIGTVESEKGFYVGDICYVLSDGVYHGVWGDTHRFHDGVFEVDELLRFAVAGTAFGDGVYEDQDTVEYGVDAGVIGLVPLELVEKDGGNELGRIFECPGVATFEAENGCFKISLPDGKSVLIDTTYDEFEENEFDEEWD